ncbi:MAG: hypothetical protein JST16_15555 [Bdellovibrionales bacterium]|nr:hypothetical protein [Bdellovibrionales bacterium]
MKRCVRQYAVFMGLLTTQCISSVSQAAAYFQTEIIHRNSKGNIHVQLVMSEALKDSAPLLADKTRHALKQAETRLGVPLREDLAFFFDAEPDASNGLATILPNNRILVQTEAPELGESIGFSQDYLADTILHELGHMSYLQQRAGIFEFFDKIFGNASRPLGLWPRWMHEGTAVWVEGATGGRPQSGVIELELRKYAEYAKRTQLEPLQSSDLDGDDGSAHHEPGNLPYHFGYLLMEAAAELSHEATPLKKLVDASSHSLGASFRALFRDNVRDLDSLFTDAKRRWAATPLPAEARKYRVLSEATSLRGPYRNGAQLSWIESRGTDTPWVLRASNDSGVSTDVQWKFHYSFPLQAYRYSGAKRWLVLARKIQADGTGTERRLQILNDDGDALCEFSLRARVRELAVQDAQLAWIRGEESGREYLERATIDVENCALKDVQLVTQSLVAFERLSTPSWTPSGQLVYSRARGLDSYHEGLELGNGTRVLLPEISGQATALGAPESLPATECGTAAESCWLAHEFSRSNWGPVLIQKNAIGWSARRLSLNTGATQSTYDAEHHRIVVRRSLWDKQQLLEVTAADFTGTPIVLTTERSRDLPTPSPVPPLDSELQNYSPWASLWPHFWMPSLAIVPDGFWIMGETFYEDLAHEWSGDTIAGYDSSVGRPFVLSSLLRANIYEAPISQLGFSAEYLPVYNYYAAPGASRAQDRWGARINAGLFQLTTREFTYSVSPQLEYLQASQSSNLAAFRYLIPSVAMRVRSPYGLDSSTPRTANSVQHWGASLGVQGGWVREAFSQGTLNFTGPLGRTAVQSTFQLAATGERNFPAQYFEWGGLPDVATSLNAGYLTRGFNPRMAYARQVFRSAIDWQFTLAKPQWTLSWNRGRVATLENHWIAETVSFAQFAPGGGTARFQLGRQYFTTVGTTLDAWSSALHYINVVASLGAFHGFGPYGDTRFTVVLRSWLDL